MGGRQRTSLFMGLEKSYQQQSASEGKGKGKKKGRK